MDNRPGIFRRTFGTTTGWGLIFCLLGIGTILLPWISAYYFKENGLRHWQGITDGILFAVLFLFLIATSPLDPAPLWHALGLFVPGVLVVTFTAVFIGKFSGGLGQLEAGPYLALGLGFGLAVLGAFEVRGVLLRWSRPREAVLVPYDPRAPLDPQTEEKIRHGIRTADKQPGGQA